ncbi:MAG: aminodeoxychorismate/anthranilate synthase component II [Lachnospiraceae bacterium]|nr:aminodeoxychorismate/anthranilate synthase component II [Lachnospiraceae bacterium]
MILLIDNYDSFSYNLYQLIGSVFLEQQTSPTLDIQVVRNDEIRVTEIRKMKPEAIFLSPGPGRPEDAGICTKIVEELAGEIPILGVCLGHQVICQSLGGEVTYAKKLMHGKTSLAKVSQESILFQELPEEIEVARYHSLAAKKDKLPDCLKIVAETEDGEIMAVEHKEFKTFGLQFHPESVLTPSGKKIIENFMKLI